MFIRSDQFLKKFLLFSAISENFLKGEKRNKSHQEIIRQVLAKRRRWQFLLNTISYQ